MGDQDNGFSAVPEIADDLQKKVNLLGSEYCGGFVKDQNFCLAVKHFQNFHSLTYGDVYFFNNLFRVNFQSVILRQFADVPVCFFNINLGEQTEKFFHRFHSHDNIFRHRIVGHQFEMLVNHSDIQFCRVIG